jgi:hypothetical protein
MMPVEAQAHTVHNVAATADSHEWGHGPNNFRYFKGHVHVESFRSRVVRLYCTVAVVGEDSGKPLGTDGTKNFSLRSRQKKAVDFSVVYDPFRYYTEGESGHVELLHCHTA